MKRLVTVLFSGFLFLAATANGAYAEPCACGGHMAQGGMDEGMHRGPRMAEGGKEFMNGSPEAAHFMWRKLMSLDLSEKQKTALKEIKRRTMKETIKKKADIEIARIELRELLDKDSVDMGAVEAKLKKTESLRTELRLSHIKAREEMKAILTPEQRKKFKEELEAAFMMEGKRQSLKKHSYDQKDAIQKQEMKGNSLEK
jgi:Spy/CpxP family protein refolding chaperone